MSRLVLGFIGARPLRLAAAALPDAREFIITVYEPDPALWNDDFTERRP